MKKFFFAFAAGLLLLAGCAKEYDDSALKEKVDALDKKVTALQTEVDKLKGDVSALQTIINEWKGGGLITKIEDVKEGGVTVGQTITFLGGKTVTLFYGKDGAQGQPGTSPVIGVKEDGGVLYWTVNGEYIISGGKKVPVNVVPSFELKEGHLWVTINGVAQDLGLISGGAPVDSIIKSIEETETTVVITLNTTPEKVIEIPLAKPFGFVFESTDFAVLSADPINIPYVLNGKTDNTTFGVFASAMLPAAIDAEKVVVTPASASASGDVLVYAANHQGQSDIVKLSFGPASAQKTDPAPEDPEGKYEDDVDYIAEAVSGAVEAHVTANVEIAVKSDAEWITVGEITKAAYTVSLTLQDNPADVIRYGNVKVVLKSNEEVVLQTLKIAQAAGEKKEADGVWVLSTNNPDMQTRVDYADDALKQLTNYTYEIRFYANTYNKLKNGWCRRLACISNENEQNGYLLRFGDGNSAVGTLKINGLIETEIAEPFTAGEWVTLSITGDGTNVFVYKNGEQIYTVANNKKMDANSFELGMSYADGSNVKNSYPYGQYFDGYIDYIRVWNVTRSQEEIKAGLCDVAKTAEGLAAYWKIEDKAKPAGIFPDVTGHGYDMNFANTHRAEANAWKDADPANVDVSALVEQQWFDYTETICVPPEPTPGINFDPENFAALDWSNKEAATWYKFEENYPLPDGFTYIIHIYPYTLNTSGMRVGNFGKQDESPCNMLRFGQNGNNAELEWMVDHGTGRSQKELLAPGFKVNKWQAVVLTADKATGEYKIYRNDELKATKTFTYNENMGFGAIEFANSWGSSWRSAFNGRMALISVYDKALSADEIKDNIFAVPVSENCVGFWPMTEGEGGLLKADQSRAIKEDIDLTKTTRTDNESDYIIVDITSNVTWTTGNKIEPELPPVPDPDTWKVDVLNNAFTGVNNYSTSYQSWSNKPGSASEAVYAGMSARGYNASELSIQLRSSNSNSGVISTTSGGKVKKIEVTFTSRTTNRIVSVYGKNEPYAAPTELYNASSQGTLLGEIQAGTDEYTLYVDGDYEYVGFRSKDGSIYLEEVKISWEPNLEN